MIKKIGFGAAFWGIMFLAVSAIMITPLSDLWQKIIEIVIAGAASYILAMLYFKKHPGSMRDVVLLWAVFMGVSAILDLLITVQYVKANNSYITGLKMFYGMWSLWVSFIISLVAMVLASKGNKTIVSTSSALSGSAMTAMKMPTPPANPMPQASPTPPANPTNPAKPVS